MFHSSQQIFLLVCYMVLLSTNCKVELISLLRKLDFRVLINHGCILTEVIRMHRAHCLFPRFVLVVKFRFFFFFTRPSRFSSLASHIPGILQQPPDTIIHNYIPRHPASCCQNFSKPVSYYQVPCYRMFTSFGWINSLSWACIKTLFNRDIFYHLLFLTE